MNKAESAAGKETRPGFELNRVAPWITLACLLWLFLPTTAMNFDHHEYTTVSNWTLGMGAASWLSITRQGSGVYRQVEWESTNVEFHPGPITAIPLSVLLLFLLLHLAAANKNTRHAVARIESTISANRPAIGRAVHLGLTTWLCAAVVLLFALPTAHETVLKRADAVELHARLTEQLAQVDHPYTLQLVAADDGPAQLKIRRYQYAFDLRQTFEPLVTNTELAQGDLSHFSFYQHPATLSLAAAIGLLAFVLAFLRAARSRDA